ncbi:MAG: Crp/Fnr family transcriptional regulator [Blastocatellia bacterium]
MTREVNCVCPSSFFMKTLTEKRKALASRMLAQKIGYLKIDNFPSIDLPTESFKAHRIIRPDNQLFVVQEGLVEIWHTAQDMFVTLLETGMVFGDMPLLGQTMLDCRAIAGSGGVILGVMDIPLAIEWASSSPLRILQEIGPRFVHAQAEHYRTTFQMVESRLAGLLLNLAGEGATVGGLTHGDLAEKLSTYRETITNSIDSLREGRLIEIGRKRITILNKKGLRELSEL